MHRFTRTLAILAIAFALPAQSAETYDLLFKEGTLDELSRETTLTYAKTTEIAADAGQAENATGSVQLAITDENMADLSFHKDDRSRRIGSFPASVGNPMIMYFYESVIRDVAQQAGGSPFYIRNRVKDSLVQPSEVREAVQPFGDEEIPTRSITLRPFEGDPNVDRMKGYGDLALTVVMSDAVPGWYHSLTASVPGDEGEEPIYFQTLVLMPQEAE
ncbi:hypothetical protein [Algicella marina]|uniref:Uncharacterized protein n=1 Tax=Algicella marina TaxID=2683284 RepID=A0A6P1T3B8_9RHOB|nr:hypothetical protein [Algicella marina]QHQ36507.1 hypothetical protein GO499_15655 [Algicella marina]